MLISGDTANSTYGKQFWKPKVNLLRITEYLRYSCQGIVALQKQKLTAGSISQEGKKYEWLNRKRQQNAVALYFDQNHKKFF